MKFETTNIHNIYFEIIMLDDDDYRVEYWQDGDYYTDREFRTKKAAKQHAKEKVEFYNRNSSTCLFYK